jgi:DNA-binding PadR family transcriptional regulator
MLPHYHSLLIHKLPFSREEGEEFLPNCINFLRAMEKKGLVSRMGKGRGAIFELTAEGEAARKRDRIDRFFMEDDFVKLDLSDRKYRKYDGYSGVVRSLHGNIPAAKNEVYVVVELTRNERDKQLPARPFPQTVYIPKSNLVKRFDNCDSQASMDEEE